MKAPCPLRAIVALSLATGCYSYQPVTATRPPLPLGRVRVTYATPRDLAIATDGAAPGTLHQVSRANGRVTRLAGDTLFLLVEATDAEAPPRAGEAAIVPGPDTKIETRQVSAWRTAALMAVIVAGTVAAILKINDSQWTWDSPGGGSFLGLRTSEAHRDCGGAGRPCPVRSADRREARILTAVPALGRTARPGSSTGECQCQRHSRTIRRAAVAVRAGE